MGVYVKNIKMPKSCEECVQEYEFYLFCDVNEGLLHDDDRDSDCPLIEIVESDEIAKYIYAVYGERRADE